MKTKLLGLLLISGLLGTSALLAQSNAGLVKERAKDLKKKVEAQRADGKKPATPASTNAPNAKPKLKPAPVKK